MVLRTLKLEVQSIIVALQFLTRLPIKATVPFERPQLTRSVTYFPLAGAIIGVITACAAWLLAYALPAWPAAVLTLAIWLGLSGGLHLDGWMDTADGVLSHRPRERMLEIMKDSRVGAMGVTAAILLLMLKASLLAELIGNEKEWLFPVMVGSTCMGRLAMSIAIVSWPAARKNEGLGAMFNGINKIRIVAGWLSFVMVSILILLINEVNYTWMLSTVAAGTLLMLLIVGSFGSWLNNKLGGLTGDTYGAINEAVEAVLLLAAVCCIRICA
ncbi:adenosylcobinamide-GDP ribazoletransferase [Paenibacillus sp. strain BS8-2]